MKKYKFLIILTSMFFFAGCATPKTMQATGGSKSDGVINMSFQYGSFEDPQVDWHQAKIDATARCKAWGYNNAEPFGGATEQCLSANGYGNCVRSQVSVLYQCLE